MRCYFNLIVAIILIFSLSFDVYASVATQSNVEYKNECLELEQYDFDMETYLENVDSAYTVLVPGRIQLGYDLKGDWSAVYKLSTNSESLIHIVPNSKTILLKSEGKKPVTAHIEQDITEIDSQIGEIEGRIWVDDYDLSAGRWCGVFSFTVNLDDEVEIKGKIASPSNATPSEAFYIEREESEWLGN